MIAFIVLVFLLSLADKIVIGERVVMAPAPKESKAPEFNCTWKFNNIDDCMEYRELRATGWKGTAEDYYRWKNEE